MIYIIYMIHLENSNFGNIFPLTWTGVPIKIFVLRFDLGKISEGVILVNPRVHFCLKGL